MRLILNASTWRANLSSFCSVVKMKYLNDSLSPHFRLYCLEIGLLSRHAARGRARLFGRPRRGDECPSYAKRVEAGSDAGNPSNGSDDAAPAGSGLFVPRTGDTMSWQGSSSRGEKRLTKCETTRPKPQTLLPIPQAAITHEDLRHMDREFVLHFVESSHGHCWEQYYAARITEPIISFLPSLRRIVRGLMCSN